jgi:hypothetical protein
MVTDGYFLSGRNSWSIKLTKYIQLMLRFRL